MELTYIINKPLPRWTQRNRLRRIGCVVFTRSGLSGLELLAGRVGGLGKAEGLVTSGCRTHVGANFGVVELDGEVYLWVREGGFGEELFEVGGE